MIYSLKKENWPLQPMKLYEFRLQPDGSITVTEVDRYEIIQAKLKNPKTEYRIPSVSGIRTINIADLDRVKNGCYTSFTNDMQVVINAFLNHFQEKKNKAQVELSKYHNTIALIENFVTRTKTENKSKTLYDFMMKHPDEDEFTVCDVDYDMETYFYHPTDPENPDEWDKNMLELAKLLKIANTEEPKPDNIVVELNQLIEAHMSEIKKQNLFIENDIDEIMDDMMSILAGNVSEAWLAKFVNALK